MKEEGFLYGVAFSLCLALLIFMSVVMPWTAMDPPASEFIPDMVAFFTGLFGAVIFASLGFAKTEKDK